MRGPPRANRPAAQPVFEITMPANESNAGTANQDGSEAPGGVWNLLEIPPSERPAWLSAVLLAPALLLLAACTVYGITEVHSSTDTYIGLAGGRAILEATDGFPVADTMSYTFQGEPWLNQNWGTHLVQYWLYRDFGPDAVIWGTWAMSASIFLCTLAAVWFRTRSLLGGLVAASVVAYGCRDFISARPATTGFFAMSAMWMLICALEGTSGSCRRRWPLVGIFVLLFLWGNSHGSFIFGYVIFGLFITYWAIVHLWRRYVRHLPDGILLGINVVLALITLVACWYACGKTLNEKWFAMGPPMGGSAYLGQARAIVVLASIVLSIALLYQFMIDRRREPSVALWQVGGVCAALVAAFLATWVLGPFGWENFVHGQEVGESEVWRSVSEWNPPYFPVAAFPPFDRIKMIMIFSTALLIVVGAVRIYALFGTPRQTATEAPAEGRAWPRLTAFDVLAIGIGLILTFFARRFAPVFLLFAAPGVTAWVILVVRQVPEVARRAPYVVSAACLIMLIPAGMEARGAIERINSFYPEDAEVGLLEKVTRFDATPNGLLDYLAKNEIAANLMTEWTQAGMVMFFAPQSRVYMDGRAQQVYDVDHYQRYTKVVMGNRTTPEAIYAELDRTRTNMVMLRYGHGRALEAAIQRNSNWIPLMAGAKGVLMIRRDDPLIQEIRARADRGEEWRPNTASAQMGLGFLYRFSDPPDPARAMSEWVSAVQRDMTTGRVLYRYIVGELAGAGAYGQAANFIRREQNRLRQSQYSQKTKDFLANQLRICERLLVQTRQQNQAGSEGG